MRAFINFIILLLLEPFVPHMRLLRIMCVLFRYNATMYYDAIIILQFNKGKGIVKVQKLLKRLMREGSREFQKVSALVKIDKKITDDIVTHVANITDERVTTLYKQTQMR